MLFTKDFWVDTLERAIRTACQAALSAGVVGGVGLFEVDWLNVCGIALVAAIAGNLVITPIYTGWPVSEVAAIIVPALLPFNLIKFVIHGVVKRVIARGVFPTVRVMTSLAGCIRQR